MPLTAAAKRRLPKLTRLLDINPTLAEAPTWASINLEPHQVPPAGDWNIWALIAGRGAGKTLAGSDSTIKHLRQAGKGARVGVMAPTQSDAIATCAEGETGLITLFGAEFPRYNRSRGEAWHYLGGYVRFLGSEQPARWNGPQWSRLWVDEAALCNPKSIDQADFGLRLGEHPRAIWTTTPKGARWLRLRLAEDGVVLTRATTYDNPHLSGRVLDRLESRYAGTTLGKQELLAELLDVPEGAVWPLLGERREELLIPIPTGDKAPRFVNAGAGADWGTTQQHLAALMGGGMTKEGVIWIRRGWRSARGTSQPLIKELRKWRDEIGIRWAAVDRSQWSLADWIEDPRNDEYGEPIGAGIRAVKGDRDVEWRVGLVLSALEQGRLFFDASDEGVVEAYEYLTQYHRDDDGEIVEEEDDDADAFCYLIAELLHPTMPIPSQLGAMRTNQGAPPKPASKSPGNRAFEELMLQAQAQRKRREKDGRRKPTRALPGRGGRGR